MNRPTTLATAEPDEKVVTEVHCAETGLPIPAIPAWYATVNVKFVSEIARQKSARAAAPLDLTDPDAQPAALEGEADPEMALDEIEIDDIEIDEADSDADAEISEE